MKKGICLIDLFGWLTKSLQNIVDGFNTFNSPCRPAHAHTCTYSHLQVHTYTWDIIYGTDGWKIGGLSLNSEVTVLMCVVYFNVTDYSSMVLVIQCAVAPSASFLMTLYLLHAKVGLRSRWDRWLDTVLYKQWNLSVTTTSKIKLL